MTTSSHETEQFSGLILLTAEDKPGLAHALFEALSPFSVTVMDLDQIIIKGRLILTIQISLNPAHQDAIEEDLNALAASLGVDIAAVFSTSTTPQKKPDTLILKLSSAKLHPKHLMQITEKIFEAGANIQDLSRTGNSPLEVTIKISGATEKQVQGVLATIDAGSDFTLSSGV